MKTEAERQLAALVAMPTITDDITANDMCLDYIENYFVSRGLHTERFRFDGHGALVASPRPGNAKYSRVLLSGHVDVMSGGEELFTLRLEDGKLKGRGVYDMKFATAGYMQLVDELHQQGRLGDYDFTIMVTTDEEYGSRDNINGTARLVEQGFRADVCLMPDSAAPGWEVEKLAKGFWRFDMIAKGRTAHGSRPWEGESASFKLVQALGELKEHFKDHGPHTDTLNIGVIQGGVTYNQIPSLMTAACEIRVISDERYAEVHRLIDTICQHHDVTYKERVYGPPVTTDLTNPLVQSYMDSVERVTGKRPAGAVSMAASDAIYINNAGIPCIISCPEGGKHHSVDEWISHESFLHFVPILHDFLQKTAIARPTVATTPVDNQAVVA
jgi:succinyl-diaminopimelate desuccinylase